MIWWTPLTSELSSTNYCLNHLICCLRRLLSPTDVLGITGETRLQAATIPLCCILWTLCLHHHNIKCTAEGKQLCSFELCVTAHMHETNWVIAETLFLASVNGWAHFTFTHKQKSETVECFHRMNSFLVCSCGWKKLETLLWTHISLLQRATNIAYEQNVNSAVWIALGA